MDINYHQTKLGIVRGNPKSKQHLVLPLSSEAAVALSHSVNCYPPPDAGTFAKLLNVVFSEEELARSCCTKATRERAPESDCAIGNQTYVGNMYVTALILLILCMCTVPSIDRPNILQVSSPKGADRRKMEQDSA